MERDWNQGELAAGLRCYRDGSFFAAHEHWESVWLHAPEPEKGLLQALIQIAAAFHHLRRGNAKGAQAQLEPALDEALVDGLVAERLLGVVVAQEAGGLVAQLLGLDGGSAAATAGSTAVPAPSARPSGTP